MDGRGEVAGVEAVRDCEQRQRGSRRVEDGYEEKCETRLIRERMKKFCEQVTRYREPREYEYVLLNEARYHAMRKGQSVTLKVRNDGSVLGVQLTDATP